MCCLTLSSLDWEGESGTYITVGDANQFGLIGVDQGGRVKEGRSEWMNALTASGAAVQGREQQYYYCFSWMMPFGNALAPAPIVGLMHWEQPWIDGSRKRVKGHHSNGKDRPGDQSPVVSSLSSPGDLIVLWNARVSFQFLFLCHKSLLCIPIIEQAIWQKN